MRAWPLIALIAVTCTGCTPRRLQQSTLDQAQTIAELQYRQVLTNLAMLHVSPGTLPSFAVAGPGGASVSDRGSSNVNLEWDASKIVGEMLGLEGSREIEEQWTLAPVVNPRAPASR